MACSEIIHSVTSKNVRQPCVGQKGKYREKYPNYWKQTANKQCTKNFRKKKISQKKWLEQEFLTVSPSL